MPELFASPPPAGVALPSGGMLLYNVPELFDGVYRWDTRRLANGVHVLFFQTASQTSAGTSVGGLKLLFNVKN